MKVAAIFSRFGPYHVARLTAAAKVIDLVGVEFFAQTTEYAWDPIAHTPDFERVTVFDDVDRDSISSAVLKRGIAAALDRIEPDVVAIPGWGYSASLGALAWCRGHGVPAVVMSESQEYDHERVWWRERLKEKIVRLCSAGLVGGKPHIDYLSKLGMPADRIFTGYDVVDNEHFGKGADSARRHRADVRADLGLPQRYILASARFIPKKNIRRLLAAYARYVGMANEHALSLILLGDGPLKDDIERWRSELGLADLVMLPGFRQYEELPSYYGLASFFVHSSTTEQWGLVVNEAMAAGLPVLVSERCGCAPDLVEDGVNGYTFEPYDVDELANGMRRLSEESEPRQMGQASRRIIADWSPSKFADGLRRAAAAALEDSTSDGRWTDQLLLGSLMRA